MKTEQQINIRSTCGVATLKKNTLGALFHALIPSLINVDFSRLPMPGLGIQVFHFK